MVAPNHTPNNAPSQAAHAPTHAPLAPPPPGTLQSLSEEDSALLTLLLEHCREYLPTFAAAAGFTLAQAMHWANQPHIAAYLAAYAHHEARAHHRAGQTALVQVMDKAPNPAELRRAATTLLRAIAQANKPAPTPRPNRGTGGSPVSGARRVVAQERSPTPDDGAPTNIARSASPYADRSPQAAPGS